MLRQKEQIKFDSIVFVYSPSHTWTYSLLLPITDKVGWIRNWIFLGLERKLREITCKVMNTFWTRT